MDDCPFHDLDRGLTVWVNDLPYSAELACITWHESREVATQINRVMSAELQRYRGERFRAGQRAY